MYSIILASGSPRRKEILEQIGVAFTIVTSEKEEKMTQKAPQELVKELSKMKAEDVAERVKGPAVILGADTVVAQDDMILGKPKSEEDAIRMIQLLQGKSHEVYTGVCILVKEADGTIRENNFAVATKVMVASMTEQEIEAYVATGETKDKAGAYAIQGKFAPYIKGIEGDYYNIVGFPIASVYQKLKELGISLADN